VGLYEFCNATRSFVVTFNSFTYSGLSLEHADQLRRLASDIHKTGCQQTATAVETGRLLIEAKAGLSHGEFGEWCNYEAGYSWRKAQNLMGLANFAEREPDVVNIPVSAGYLLAAPSAPEHIIQQVLSEAKSGGRVLVSWVEELLDEGKKKEPKPPRRSTSEVTKIAKLLVNALEPGQATNFRTLLEAAGATLVQRFVSQLQSQLEEKLHETGAAQSLGVRAQQQVAAL
jgi:hypothetical protein